MWANLRKILIFNLPVNFAQGTSILWAYIIGFDHAPLTAIQVCACVRACVGVCARGCVSAHRHHHER